MKKWNTFKSIDILKEKCDKKSEESYDKSFGIVLALLNALQKKTGEEQHMPLIPNPKRFYRKLAGLRGADLK
jgi:hypothetical protein